MKRLKVHGNYLSWDDGMPFFYLADTAWELFHHATREEITEYLTIRKEQGFNAVQAVALAEFNGLEEPNAYGRRPLIDNNPAIPDDSGEYSYWAHVDFAVEEAAKRGMFITLLPTWGDKYNLAHGVGPVVFTKENAYLYGKWIAARYRNHQNIIWMLGGDRALVTQEHRDIIDAMGTAIREADPNHLITFHPCGAASSVEFVKNKPYIDFHAIQSGHGVECYSSAQMLRETFLKEPKPFLDAEPRYEDHPACFSTEYGYFWEADEVRQNAYWDLLAGESGHTYGNHCVWGFNRETSDYFPYPYTECLRHPGAEQMRYVKALRLSRPYFELCPCQELLLRQYPGMAQLAAARGNNYLFAYTPMGLPMELHVPFGNDLKAIWFNPRTGEENTFGIIPSGPNTFVPPTNGKGQDWVLILDVLR